MQHLSPISRPFVLMHPIKFLFRSLFFPFQVGFMGDDDSGGSTPQNGPQMQIPHPQATRERGGSDGLVMQEYSSDSTVGNKTECIKITRKFRATNLSDR